MKAKRADSILEDIAEANTQSEFQHLEHMYGGRFSDYYHKRLDRALHHLTPGEDVLELGGGTGLFTASLVEHANNVFFVDIAQERPLFETPRKLLTASGEVDSVSFLAGDGSNLPLANNVVDTVFALDVLEHLPPSRESAAVQEASRVLRDGGKFIITAPIEIGPALLVRETYRRFDGRTGKTDSLSELVKGVLGHPSIREQGHRGYDYRETIDYCKQYFDEVSVSYCPLPVRWCNPTAVITAEL